MAATWVSGWRGTSIRVVCNNTLNIALTDSVKGKQKVSTSHSTVFKPNAIKSQLGLYEGAWDRFSNEMQVLSCTPVSAKDAYNLILELIATDDADPSAAEIRTTNEIHNLYMGGGMGADMAGKTAFGLLNAFTEYYDHHVGRIASNKLNSSFWGISNTKKLQAYDTIMSTFNAA